MPALAKSGYETTLGEPPPRRARPDHCESRVAVTSSPVERVARRVYRVPVMEPYGQRLAVDSKDTIVAARKPAHRRLRRRPRCKGRAAAALNVLVHGPSNEARLKTLWAAEGDACRSLRS